MRGVSGFPEAGVTPLGRLDGGDDSVCELLTRFYLRPCLFGVADADLPGVYSPEAIEAGLLGLGQGGRFTPAGSGRLLLAKIRVYAGRFGWLAHIIPRRGVRGVILLILLLVLS